MGRHIRRPGGLLIWGGVYSRTTKAHGLLVKIKLKVVIKLIKARIQRNNRSRKNIQNSEEFGKSESVRKKCQNSEFSEEFGRSGNPASSPLLAPPLVPMKLTSINFSHFFIKDITEKIILYLHVSKQTVVEIKRKNIS